MPKRWQARRPKSQKAEKLPTPMNWPPMPVNSVATPINWSPLPINWPRMPINDHANKLATPTNWSSMPINWPPTPMNRPCQLTCHTVVATAHAVKLPMLMNCPFGIPKSGRQNSMRESLLDLMLSQVWRNVVCLTSRPHPLWPNKDLQSTDKLADDYAVAGQNSLLQVRLRPDASKSI
ncbi:hypothetical protein E2P81_ATG10385 [Venturia nashicola]|nr:hypothetical protein E2P81_ATG10385 [Venturia nashicola]